MPRGLHGHRAPIRTFTAIKEKQIIIGLSEVGKEPAEFSEAMGISRKQVYRILKINDFSSKRLQLDKHLSLSEILQDHIRKLTKKLWSSLLTVEINELLCSWMKYKKGPEWLQKQEALLVSKLRADRCLRSYERMVFRNRYVWMGK